MYHKIMKLALVYPQFSHKIFNENLPIVDNEFGTFPHINFGYVAKEAKEAQWDVKLFDLSASTISYSVFLKQLRNYNPDLIGYAAHAAQSFHDLLVMALKIKVDVDVPTLVGGYEAKKYPVEIMEHKCFDYLCSGGAESFLPFFLKEFEAEKDYSKVPFLYYRHEGRLIYTFDGEIVPFKDLGMPDRSLFDHSLYHSHVSQRKQFTIGVSSNGCPFTCNYCCMESSGFDAKSGEQIFEEMYECVNKYDIHEIDWFDPVMFHDKKRIYRLSELLLEERLDIIWSVRARIDSLVVKKGDKTVPDENFIRTISEAGCRRVFIGIESANEQILKNMRKRITTRNTYNVVKTLSDNGISVLGFFMTGGPGETIETMKQTIAFSKTLPLDYAQFCMTIMKPHTTIYDEYLKNNPDDDFWRNYIKGEVKEKILSRPWTDLSNRTIKKYTKRGYVSFYFRPKYIYRMLKKIQSLEELSRYVRVAIRLLLRPL